MLATWLSWKLFFQSRKKAVAGKQAMWKNSPLLHDLFLCCSQSRHPTGAGSGERGRRPKLTEESSSSPCADRPKGHGSNKKCADKSWRANVIRLFYFYSFFFPFTVFLLKNDSAQVVKRLIVLGYPQILLT